MLCLFLVCLFFLFPLYPKEADVGKHSFWKLVTLPKVVLNAFVIISSSSCFGFLDPTLSLFVLEKVSSLLWHANIIAGSWALLYGIPR